MKSAPSVAVALLLMVCSALAAPAQEPPAAPKTASVVDSSAPSSKVPRFKATLVILEADWSKAPTAKQIEQDLQAALQDVPIPDNLRQNLAASGPQILFAPEQFHAYRPEDADSLFVWLDQHKLVKTRIDYVIPDRAAGAESDDDAALAVDLELLPVKVRFSPPSPFVRQRVEWRWSFFPGLPVPGFPPTRDAEVPDHSEATIIVRRRLVEFEEFAGQPKQNQRRQEFDDTAFGLSFPRDRVAVVHALAGGVLGETGPKAARKLGAEAVLLVRDASLSVPALEGRGEGSGAVRVAELIQQVFQFNGTRFLSALAEGRPRGPSAPPLQAPASDQSGYGPSAPPRQVPPQPLAETLKVFSLQHIEATTAASIVSQLFGSDSLAVAVDARGNTLIARGDEAKLAVIEALLLRLDEEPTGNAATRTPPAEPKSSTDAESASAQYRDLEKQAAHMTAEYQQLRAKYADSHPQVKALKDRLRQQVSATFEARQQWQNAELSRLRARLAAIEQSLSARERIKDTIIDRRVEELLDPDLQWTPPGRDLTDEKKVGQSTGPSRKSSPALPSREGLPSGPQYGGKTCAEWLDVLNTERKPELLVEAFEAFEVIGGETVAENVGRATLRLMRTFMRDDGQIRVSDPNGRALVAGSYLLLKLPSPTLAALMTESLSEGDARGRWYPTLFLLMGNGLVPEGKAQRQSAFGEFRNELSERSSTVLVSWLQRLQTADADQRHWMFQTAARFPWSAADAPSPAEFRRSREEHLRGDDKDRALLSAMVLAQMHEDTPDLVDRLIKALDDPDLPRQDGAITALGALGDRAGPAAGKLTTLLETRWNSAAADRARGHEPPELNGLFPLTPGQPDCVLEALAGIGPAAKVACPLLERMTGEGHASGTMWQRRLGNRLFMAVRQIGPDAVAMIEVTMNDQPGLLPINSNGVLLPPEEFPVERTRDYLRVSVPGAAPAGPAGTPWGDPRVAAAGRIARYLYAYWKQLGLYRIEVQGDTSTPATADETTFRLTTRQGAEVVWGRAPRANNSEDAEAATVKLQRLLNYVASHGPLDTPKPDMPIDLSDADRSKATVGVEGDKAIPPVPAVPSSEVPERANPPLDKSPVPGPPNEDS